MFVVLLAVAVLIAAVAAGVRFTATSEWWWERGFAGFDAARRTGLPAEEVSRIGAEVREYLTNGEERLTVRYSGADGREAAFFSEREVQHMVDVKVLMERTWAAGLAALVLLACIFGAALALRRRLDCGALSRAAVIGGLLGTGIIAVLAIVAVAGFDESFRQFHLLFFTNDLWQLTSQDRLIQLFPQRFFFETTLLIGGIAVAAALCCTAIGAIFAQRANRAAGRGP